MNYELQFLIMVDCRFGIDELLNRIKRDWKDVKWVKRSSFDLLGNWIQVSENDDFDPNLVSDPKDGFLYYRFRIEVSPIRDTAILPDQVELAKRLKLKFENMGCLAEICADFEEQLG